jgi:hypothetical protein
MLLLMYLSLLLLQNLYSIAYNYAAADGRTRTWAAQARHDSER